MDSANRSGSRPGASTEITAGVKISASRQEDDLHPKQQCENPVGEPACRLRPTLPVDAGVGRDEGRVERTFRKNRPEMIR